MAMSASSTPVAIPLFTVKDFSSIQDAMKSRPGGHGAVPRGIDIADQRSANEAGYPPELVLNSTTQVSFRGKLVGSNKEIYNSSLGVDVESKPKALLGYSCDCPVGLKSPRDPMMCKHVVALFAWYQQSKDAFRVIGQGGVILVEPTSQNSSLTPRGTDGSSLNTTASPSLLLAVPSPGNPTTPPSSLQRERSPSPSRPGSPAHQQQNSGDSSEPTPSVGWKTRVIKHGEPLPTTCDCGQRLGQPKRIRKKDSPNLGSLYLGCPLYFSSRKNERCNFFVIVEEEAPAVAVDAVPAVLAIVPAAQQQQHTQPLADVEPVTEDPAFSEKPARTSRKRKAPSPPPKEAEEEPKRPAARSRRVSKRNAPEIEPQPEPAPEPEPESEPKRRRTRSSAAPEHPPPQQTTPRRRTRRSSSIHSEQTTLHAESQPKTEATDGTRGVLSQGDDEFMEVDVVPTVELRILPDTAAAQEEEAQNEATKVSASDEKLDKAMKPTPRERKMAITVSPKSPRQKVDLVAQLFESQPKAEELVPVPSPPRKEREKSPVLEMLDNYLKEVDEMIGNNNLSQQDFVVPETQFDDAGNVIPRHRSPVFHREGSADSHVSATPADEEARRLELLRAETESVDSPPPKEPDEQVIVEEGGNESDKTDEGPVRVVRRPKPTSSAKQTAVSPTLTPPPQQMQLDSPAPVTPKRTTSGKRKHRVIPQSQPDDDDDGGEEEPKEKKRAVSPSMKRTLPAWMSGDSKKKGGKETKSPARSRSKNPPKMEKQVEVIPDSVDSQPKHKFKNPFSQQQTEEPQDAQEEEEMVDIDALQGATGEKMMGTQGSVGRVDTLGEIVGLYIRTQGTQQG